MKSILHLALIAVMISGTSLPAATRKKTSRTPPANKADMKAAAGLQVFLDRANFSSGKIDGRYNDLTQKALALYRQSRGGSSPIPSTQINGKSNRAPDVTDLDLASVQPVFIPYTVTEADIQSVGPLPSKVSAESKLKFLPYGSASDALAEKFHCDVHLLDYLNPGKMKTIKPGDQLMVPNVEPFELASVKALTPGSEVNAQVANDMEEQTGTQSENFEQNKGVTTTVIVKVDTKINMLEVYEADKLTAAYPVTIGSAHTASPIGEWKVRGIAKLPTFRYDKEMLQHGKRSGDFYLLPPGPRNPVGVMWIALNKKGIGIHGTNEPDSIGRAASHGCIRLTNWDVVRLATKIKGGDSVSIH